MSGKAEASAAAVVALLALLHAMLPAGCDLVRDLIGLICLSVVVMCLGLGLLAFSPLALGFRELPAGKARRGILHERYSASKVGEGVWDAIVVGSGMGGLSCAASLARFGKRVLVLEQHEMAGGGTHTFVVDGKVDYTFDSGLHYTVPQSGELLQLACGTRHKPVTFDHMGEADGCFDKVVLGDVRQDGFRVKHGPAHLEALRKQFPDDQRELNDFLRVATMVNNRIPLWLVSKALPGWARRVFKAVFLRGFSRWAARTGEEVTRELVSNPKLAATLCGLWMDAGSPPDRATFMMTAALSVGFPKEGGAYPTGGAEGMATCLVQAVEASGGKVLMRARVAEILVEGGRAVGVRVADGTEVRAAVVVSACGYGNTYTKLLPEAAVPHAYAPRDAAGKRQLPPSLANSASWIMANVGLRVDPKEAGIGCSNVWVQPVHERLGWDLFTGIREYFERPLEVETVPMMMTFPSVKDRACTDGERGRLTCQLLALAGQGWFDQWWADGGKHEPGGAYEQLKRRWQDRLMQALLRRYPSLEGKVDFVDLSTPLSIMHYLNKPGGGAVGLDLTPQRFCDAHTEDLLDMRSPVDGLWLTGEDVLLCGQPLAQLSGILTSWRVAGLRAALSFVLGIVRLALSDLLGL